MARGWVPPENPVTVRPSRSPSSSVPGVRCECSVRLNDGATYTARVVSQIRGRTRLGNFRDAAGRAVIPSLGSGTSVTVVWGGSDCVYGRTARVCDYNESAHHIEVELGDRVEVPDRRRSHRLRLRRPLTLFVLGKKAGGEPPRFGLSDWIRGLSEDVSVDTVRVWSREIVTEGLSVFVSLGGRRQRWERTAEVVRADVPQGLLGWWWKRLVVLRWLPTGDAVQREWLSWVAQELSPRGSPRSSEGNHDPTPD